jgi:hypothetical protein
MDRKMAVFGVTIFRVRPQGVRRPSTPHGWRGVRRYVVAAVLRIVRRRTKTRLQATAEFRRSCAGPGANKTEGNEENEDPKSAD